MEIKYGIGGTQTGWNFIKKPDIAPFRFILPAESNNGEDWEFTMPTADRDDLTNYMKSWSVKRGDNKEEIRHSDETSGTTIEWRAPDSYESKLSTY
jgi:hypothetical protein